MEKAVKQPQRWKIGRGSRG